MGLKDRLASRRHPQTVVRLRMDFSPESDQALRELAVAESDLESAKARGVADLLTYERAVRYARERAESFHEQLTVRAISPDDMDALQEAHPPTDEQKKESDGGRWVYNPDTFAPALLAACVESDMTEADWSDLIHKGPVSSGEVGFLVQTAFDINNRSPNPDLGKG